MSQSANPAGSHPIGDTPEPGAAILGFANAYENLIETARTVQLRIERDGRPDVTQFPREFMDSTTLFEQAWKPSSKIAALSEGLVGYTGRYTRNTTTPETVADGVQEWRKLLADFFSSLREFWRRLDVLDSLAADATSPVFSGAVRHLQYRPNVFVENILISRAAWNQVEALRRAFRSLRLLDGLFDRLSMPIEFPERDQTISAAERTIDLLANHRAPNRSDPGPAFRDLLDDEHWMTISDAARMTGISKGKLSHDATDGKITDNGLPNRKRRLLRSSVSKYEQDRAERE